MGRLQERRLGGPDVVANLGKLAPVPPALEAAILAGAQATARYCVELRKQVNAAAADPARQKECEQIANALTSRITELVYATSQSPLQYRQLADLARWAADFGGGAAAPGAAPADKPADAAGAAAKPASDPVEAHAARLAAQAGFRVGIDGKDEIRGKGHAVANDTSTGDAAGLPGWTFIHDPFDNTVVAIKDADETGTQYCYKVVQTDGGPQLQLDHTEALTKLRIGALRRMDKAGLGEKQETATGRDKRIAKDQEKGEEARAEWGKAHPVEYADYQKKVAEWTAMSKDEKKGKTAPAMPKGMPGNKMTTSCTDWPSPVYTAGGGVGATKFSFTPPAHLGAWRTPATNPEGPKPGDIYWLWDMDKKQTAHMGVVKSRISIGENLETWVVSDGGQGGYAQIQEVQERERGPYNTKTAIFDSSIAEAGQSKGQRRLDGWVDIDAHNAEFNPAAKAAAAAEGDGDGS